MKVSLEQYILDRVVVAENGCWLWTGSYSGNGRPRICHDKKQYSASRVSFEVFKKEKLGDRLACHSCDDERCVNPDHLWAGTHDQNMVDMVQKQRSKSSLSDVAVLQLMKMRESGITYRECGEEFEVSPYVVYQIIKGKNFKHLRGQN